MNLEILKNTIRKEKTILREINHLIGQSAIAKSHEKAIYDRSVFALIHELSVLNDSIPHNIGTETIQGRKVPSIPMYRIKTDTGELNISEHEKDKFIRDLKIEKTLMKKIKSKIKESKKEKGEARILEQAEKSNVLMNMSTSLFGSLAYSMSKNGFKSLHYSLRKANMPFLLSAYLSIVFFSTFIAFFVGLLGSLILSVAMNATAIEFLRNVVISLALPFLTFIIVYLYPGSKISSNKQDIENELPFAVVHMSAIASSGVSPDKIFQIIALSKEYKLIAREAKKIVNQINIYGYDLTTSLKNVASMTSSRKFAELLNGMSATITGGGNLASYLNEKAKDFLLEYRLSREKYSETIGMYADIYTALLIAAPLIFMLILVIMGSMGTSILGFDSLTLSTIGIVVIALLNIIFLVFLQFTQPKT